MNDRLIIYVAGVVTYPAVSYALDVLVILGDLWKLFIKS